MKTEGNQVFSGNGVFPCPDFDLRFLIGVEGQHMSLKEARRKEVDTGSGVMN